MSPGDAARRYLYCPRTDREAPAPPQLAAAVKRFLAGEGYAEEEAGHPVNLVVVALPIADHLIESPDLFVFRDLFETAAIRVLLIDPHSALLLAPTSYPDWLYVVGGRQEHGGRRLFSAASLRDWLGRPAYTSDGTSPVDSAAKLEKLQVLLARHALASGNQQLPLGDLLTKPDFSLQEITRRISYLLTAEAGVGAAQALADFCLGVYCMTTRYNRYEHNLNRARRTPGVAEEALKLNAQKRFLDACRDLWDALRFPVAPVPEGQSQIVLLIDDNIEPILADLQSLATALPKRYELLLWQPRGDADCQFLERLARYNSLLEPDQSHLITLRELSSSGGEQQIPFDKLLERCRFALVDLLLKDASGNSRELGYGVIRGLRRWAADRETSRRGAAAWSAEPDLLAVLAISWSDEAAKMETALRSGAAGYVSKTRILSVLGILGRIREARTESEASALHQNFRLLYNLPNETISLLRSCSVPTKLSFHQTQESHEALDAKAQAFASLLLAVPKTDLHVHVGSCMSPEFLVAASLVMLVRQRDSPAAAARILTAIPALVDFWEGRKDLRIAYGAAGLDLSVCFKGEPITAMRWCGNQLRERLMGRLDDLNSSDEKSGDPTEDTKRREYSTLRALLHAAAKVPDYLSPEDAKRELGRKPPSDLMLLAIAFGEVEGTRFEEIGADDVLRIFILFLAAREAGSRLEWQGLEVKPLSWFSPEGRPHEDEWGKVQNYFKSETVGALTVTLGSPDSYSGWPLDSLLPKPCITRLLASGTRSRNLVEYLEGCEFSGAMHLRQPYLMKLYAQQTLHDFVRQGILYAELRSAVTGYATAHFPFKEACASLLQAFSEAQELIYRAYRERTAGSAQGEPKARWLWGLATRFDLSTLFPEAERYDLLKRRLPVKIGLIFTGKRHKPTRQMIQEAAASVVLYTATIAPSGAGEFVQRSLTQCNPVGFDLAGQEREYPPALFKTEFEQLSKLHIPITAHAGENATAQFVESAVLDLRARRLGHGLALLDDARLMDRVREERICVELCPVSNYQTNQFSLPTQRPVRAYPLKKMLENGNAVCINTDNPVISHTNIVKEYFQASFAIGGEGLSLWDTLRIVRMGFVHSFMSLPERRAVLEIADQIVFDLFSSEAVVDVLRGLATALDTGPAIGSVGPLTWEP